MLVCETIIIDLTVGIWIVKSTYLSVILATKRGQYVASASGVLFQRAIYIVGVGRNIERTQST